MKVRRHADTQVVRGTAARRGLVALWPALPPRRSSVAAGYRRLCSTPAFTIVELIVVMSVIVLILAIAIPGLNAIAAESRFSAAVQITNGALTHAYTAALADLNMTAVRFVPGKWDNDPSTSESGTTGRQHIVTYSFTPTSAADPVHPGQVVFGEYFQRRPGTSSVILPEDVWVAPIEALETGPRTIPICEQSTGALTQRKYESNFGQEFVVAGDPRSGEFVVDAARTDAAPKLYQADDFLIIFDPRAGMRGVIGPNRIRGPIKDKDTDGGYYDAAQDKDNTDVHFRRYNFTGVTLYHRSAFLNATRAGMTAADARERQEWLRNNSRPFLIHRFGGGLVSGAQSEGEQP
jgi:type II secretory pathway pseudopilin PulG